MIKLGIFGDQFTNTKLLEQLKTMPGVMVSGVYFSGNSSVPEGYNELASPEGLMDVSDALLILSEKSVSSDLIRMVLRKSKHLYLKSIPNLNVREIKELIGLEKEAGIVTYTYNPFNYIPWLDLFKTNYEKPFLINLRTCFEGVTIKPSQEILLLVTAVNSLSQSNSKKIEVFGMNESGDKLIINLRVEYENGSVINITLSQEKLSGYCEIFEHSGRTKHEFEGPLYVLYPEFNQEYTAISKFIQLISIQDKKTNIFDNLLNGLHIIHEIKEHLRFNEIVF